MKGYGFTLLLACFLWEVQLAYSGLSDEELLDTKLSEQFDVRVRPRVSKSEPANVSVSLSLLHIHSLDVNRAELDFTLQIKTVWTDPRLWWDVAQTENNVRQLVLPVENVWTPDITITNAVGKIVPIQDDQVIVESDGVVSRMQAYRSTIGCKTNTTSDEQSCIVHVAPWSFDLSGVDIYTTNENFSAAEEFFSHEWELMDSYIERVNKTRNDEVYACLEVTLNLLSLVFEETEPTPEPSRMTQRMTSDNFACVVSPSIVLKILAICLCLLTAL